MSAGQQLRSYIAHLEQRLRLGALLAGGAIVTAAALLTTVLLVLIINRFAFSMASLWSARAALFAVLLVSAAFGLAIPLRRLNRRWAAHRAERAFPQFKQRLVTFAERDATDGDPFLELLAADTLAMARTADANSLAPDRWLLAWLGTGIASLGLLLWLAIAGPGYLGYGTALLWTGPHSAPMYDIHVTPGNAVVRRNASQLVTAQPVGVNTDKVRIYTRYRGTSKFEQVAMQPQPGAHGFQFLFAGIPEDVEYYVEAGKVQSRHFQLHVAEVPSVVQIRVRYHYPAWTGLPDAVEENGGDLKALAGTDAQLEILTDRPLTDGVLVLDDGKQIPLLGGDHNRYRGALTLDKDGTYHVAALEQRQPVRLSEDYFIEASQPQPPEVAIVRPMRDYPASPIEEVTIGAKASDAFSLTEFTLHYSVNGGPEKSINLLKQAGAKQASGYATLSLEEFKLVPGDIVSLYASAKDARAESHTDIAFIQTEPFEREFSQSQQGGGGGGGGGGGDIGAQISQREKEIIAATWKQSGDKNATQQQAAEQAKFLASVQTTLSAQAQSLAGRLQMRDLNQANEQFSNFQQDMIIASQAMGPAAEKLQQQKWSAAIPNEQTALQHLLRAEATFRQIQVAFGAAGGGGGGVNSAGRDLASLFDLELDTQKNQYETGQTASSAQQRAQEVDDALKKLDELARRQNDLSASRNGTQDFQQRWQQEMLRRDAEELQRRMEQLTRSSSSSGSSASSQSSNGQSSNGQSGDGQSNGQSNGQSSNGQSANGESDSGQSSEAAQSSQRDYDAKVQQALEQLRQANRDMQRAAERGNNADARLAANRLREATNLLSGLQQQRSSQRLDSLSSEAERLAEVQRQQAGNLRRQFGGPDSGADSGVAGGSTSGSAPGSARGSAPGSARGSGDSAQPGAGAGTRESMVDERQRLADDLTHLEQALRDAEQQLMAGDRAAAGKLRDALTDLDQADVETKLQRSADWLRRGIDPNTNANESQIQNGLQHLSDQVRAAKGAMGEGQVASARVLDQLERLRAGLSPLDRNGNPRAGQPGSGQPGSGQRGSGQPGSGQPGSGQPGSGQAGSGQPGSGQAQGGGAGGQVGTFVNGAGGGARNGGPVFGALNSGNNPGSNAGPHVVAPETSSAQPDSESGYPQQMTDLRALRQAVGDDPQTRAQVDELIRAMQKLDPSRFPGNPAMVAALHAQVLSDIDKLELQINRPTDEQQPGQVRSSDALPVPAGYQDAVAEYYRRLSKNP